VTKKIILASLFLLCMIQICRFGLVNLEYIYSCSWNECGGFKDLYIVAHEDDDLLFMNPDIYENIRNGHAVETIYVTAGDKRKPPEYWMAREAGARDAYAYMTGVRNRWIHEALKIGDKKIVRFILKDRPRIGLVFLRLPDGIDIRKGEVTLQTIFQYDQVIIASKDQANIYRQAELTKVLTILTEEFEPSTFSYIYPGNHVDHFFVAKFAQWVESRYHKPHTVYRYRDYGISRVPVNLSDFDTYLKWTIAAIYGKHDEYFPKFGHEKNYPRYFQWCRRQYYYPGWFFHDVIPFQPVNPFPALPIRYPATDINIQTAFLNGTAD
jgi:LmbE family N-acetylglucosaminyl deacetylase